MYIQTVTRRFVFLCRDGPRQPPEGDGDRLDSAES